MTVRIPPQAAGAAFALASFLVASIAGAQIKQPGDHPMYSVELEPHVLVYWDGEFGADEGFGLGFRAAIPVVDNGPVPTINNNLAIGFGLDWGHFSDSCWAGWWNGWRGPRPPGWADYDCTENDIFLPAVAQWNFFFTPVVSAFVEVGLGFEYAWLGYDGPECQGCDDTEFSIEPSGGIGARFLFSDAFGLTVRLGWPYFSVGPAILM